MKIDDETKNRYRYTYIEEKIELDGYIPASSIIQQIQNLADKCSVSLDDVTLHVYNDFLYISSSYENTDEEIEKIIKRQKRYNYNLKRRANLKEKAEYERLSKKFGSNK